MKEHPPIAGMIIFKVEKISQLDIKKALEKYFNCYKVKCNHNDFFKITNGSYNSYIVLLYLLITPLKMVETPKFPPNSEVCISYGYLGWVSIDH